MHINKYAFLIKGLSTWGMRTSLSVLFGFSGTLRACRHAVWRGGAQLSVCPLKDVVITSEAQKSCDEEAWQVL